MKDLVPCPFCGSKNLTANEWCVDDNRFGADEFGEIAAVECADCLGSAPLVSWGRRAELGADQEESK